MSKDEDGFEIHRKEKLGKTWEWIPLAWTKANVNTYEDRELAADTIYRYRIRAYSAGGYSRFSKAVKVRTKNSNK